MPREIAILSRTDHDVAAVAQAARAVRGVTGVRTIDGGAAVQVTAPGGEPVLTVYRARRLATEGEVARLLPEAPAVPLPTWWCDAVAPFGDAGDVGVRVALELALALDAVCVVAD